MNDEFYLTLLSNASFEQYPQNLTGSFTVDLNREINLSGNWGVALSEMIYPNTLFNVSEANNKIIFTFSKVIRERDYFNENGQFVKALKGWEIVWKTCEIVLDPNHYHSVEFLIDSINALCTKKFKCTMFEKGLTGGKHCTVAKNLDSFKKFFSEGGSSDFTETSKRTNAVDELDRFKGKVSSSENPYPESLMTVSLEGRLCVQLGFTPENNIFELRGKVSPFPTHIDFGIPSQFFCYVDIVEPQFVSGSQAKVLKIVKALEKNSLFGDTESKEILNRNYLGLSKKRFHQISVDIRDATGRIVPFAFGNSMLQLHFQKRNSANENEQNKKHLIIQH
jgi:hypothetical protein